MKVYLLQFNYKSGISMNGEFKSFSFDGQVFKWEAYAQGGFPLPAVFGASEVESVWELGVREVGEVTE